MHVRHAALEIVQRTPRAFCCSMIFCPRAVDAARVLGTRKDRAAFSTYRRSGTLFKSVAHGISGERDVKNARLNVYPSSRALYSRSISVRLWL